MERVRRSEIQLFLHAFAMFLILTSLISLWHFYYLILPDTVWTVFSINIYWILYCGLNPIIYIIFSKSIRVSYLRHMGLLSPKAPRTTPLVVTMTSRH
ncbi:hypothetical protein GCK32_017326 [Trichostrongylus colubriformis]|uniref:G-protein coupled receptors family 1 profile domain-containing protein n=1 Tax=Trichostrongylus colubriformis TaxID=6319 RepID=A0AAN8FMS8_TRICO